MLFQNKSQLLALKPGSKVNRMAVSGFLMSQETYVPRIELGLELKADYTSPMLFS